MGLQSFQRKKTCYDRGGDSLYSVILDGIQTAYEVAAPMLMFCQGMMMLEIAHAVFGLVKSGIMAPTLQVEY